MLDLVTESKMIPKSPETSTTVISEIEGRRRERDNIVAALRQAGFRISGSGGAAELLGIHPGTLASRMKVLGIEREAKGSPNRLRQPRHLRCHRVHIEK